MGDFIPHELDALPVVVSSVVQEAVKLTRTEIVKLAAERLGGSKQEYVQGLRQIEMSPVRGLPEGQTVATLTLEGFLPVALEEGWDGGDMKPGLLAGAPPNPAGGPRYRDVTFRALAQGGGRRGSTTMGNPYMPSFRVEGGAVERTGMATQAEARSLGRQVYAAASRLQTGQRLPEGQFPKLREKHKTDIYGGLRRSPRAQGGSEYRTFRRVSENSASDSWIHPGIEGHHLFEEAKNRVGDKIALLTDQAIRGLTGRK